MQSRFLVLLADLYMVIVDTQVNEVAFSDVYNTGYMIKCV